MGLVEASWHHFIPRFHLRNFAISSKARDKRSAKLWVWDKDNRSLGLQTVAAVAAGWHLYTVEPRYGPRDAAEREYTRMETSVAPIVSRLLCGDPIPSPGSAERAWLSLYLASLHYRNPMVRAELERSAKAMASSYMDQLAGPGDKTPEDLEFLHEHQKNPTETNWEEVSTQIGVVLANEFRDQLAAWQWCLQTLPEEVLVLGDNPFLFLVSDNDPTPIGALPLNPKTLLVLTPGDGQERRYLAPELHPGLVRYLHPRESEFNPDTVGVGVCFWQWFTAESIVMSSRQDRLRELANSMGPLANLTGDRVAAMIGTFRGPGAVTQPGSGSQSSFLIQEVRTTSAGQPVVVGHVEAGHIREGDRLTVSRLGLAVRVDKVHRLRNVFDDGDEAIGLVLDGVGADEIGIGMRLIGSPQ